MRRTNAPPATRKKGYIATGVVAAVLMLLAVMPLGVLAAPNYDYQATEAIEQQDGFTSLDAGEAYELMSVTAFTDAGMTPLSNNRVIWKPHEPVITVPIGQDFVYIYFTLDRPINVARPMGQAMTSIQLLYPAGAFGPGAGLNGSFVFHVPIVGLCTCCFGNPDPPFRGSIQNVTSSVNGDQVTLGGSVGRLYYLILDPWERWNYYGEIVIRVRLLIPPHSPLNNPESVYQDITVRRGNFSIDGTVFGNEYSTVRIAREVHPEISFENLPATGLVHADQRVELNNNLLLSAPGTAQVVRGGNIKLDAGTVEGQTFLGWFQQTGPNPVAIPALGDTVPGVPENGANPVHTFVMPEEAMPHVVAVRYVAVWGNSEGIVGGTNHNISISNVPDVAVAEQTINTQAVITLPLGSSATVSLNAGTAENSTFLGWFQQTGPNPVAIPAPGDIVQGVSKGGKNPIHSFQMPSENVHYVAVWGNVQGVVGGTNYNIAFHIYTGNQGLIDRFGYHGTPNADGILVINVPVIPGTPSSEWPNQELLNAALSIDLVLGVSGTPGHAFWGWFRDETLNNSGRIGPTASAEIPNPTNPGLRRPLLTDRCEWITNEVDRGPQNRIFALLQNPSITQAQIDNLFGTTGTLDLFAIWSLWGDVNDDDIVNFTDHGILQAHLLFRYADPYIIDINRRAGDVFNNASLDWTDFNLLQSYLLTRYSHPGVIILGVLPPPAPTSSYAHTVFEQMSITTPASVDIAQLSNDSVTWQPHEPIITVPAGQNFVDIYFTFDRPYGVVRSMGVGATSIQLLYPTGSFGPGAGLNDSFVFHEPIVGLCTCCFATPYPPFQGQIDDVTSLVMGGQVTFGGSVSRLYYLLTDPVWQRWDYYGDIVIRVRLMIPPMSPVNNPEIGFQDIIVRRGGFTCNDGTIFLDGYSTVRIAR